MSRVVAYTSAAAAAAAAVASFAGGMLSPVTGSQRAEVLLIGGGMLSFVAGALVVAAWNDARRRQPVPVGTRR